MIKEKLHQKLALIFLLTVIVILETLKLPLMRQDEIDIIYLVFVKLKILLNPNSILHYVVYSHCGDGKDNNYVIFRNER